MHIIELVGRIFLAALFLIEGVGKLFTQETGHYVYGRLWCAWYAVYFLR